MGLSTSSTGGRNLQSGYIPGSPVTVFKSALSNQVVEQIEVSVAHSGLRSCRHIISGIDYGFGRDPKKHH